ncbi:MAG TPA: hypothetical protein VGK19_19505 [Capsulimonadaceae bacterium]
MATIGPWNGAGHKELSASPLSIGGRRSGLGDDNPAIEPACKPLSDSDSNEKVWVPKQGAA